MLAETDQTLAQFDQTQAMLIDMLADVEQVLTNHDKTRSQLGNLLSELASVDQDLCGQIRPELGRS